MSFLFPAFLIGAVAIAVPVVLHLLRRDVAPDLPFTAVRLLKRSPVERSRRRRLRDILLLAARVTALLLLAAAFARPFSPAAASAVLPLRVVALDRSFSMGAPERFEHARELARAAVDEASFQQRVAVVAFDERADVVAPAGPAGDARRAIDTIHSGFAATRYSVMLEKVMELAVGGPARVVVITDLQRSGWDGESQVRIPASLEVEVRAVRASGNAGIVAAHVEAQTLVASIRNTHDEPRRGFVIARHNGREMARTPFATDAHSSADVTFPWTSASGAVSLEIEDPGGFPADDRRFLVSGVAGTPGVLLVASPDSPGFYLRRALEVAEAEPAALRARVVTPAEIAGGRAESIARHRAIVLLSTRGLDRAARDGIADFVRRGGGLLVAAAPDVEPAALEAIFGWKATSFGQDDAPRQLSLTVTDIRHPIFRPFVALSANFGQVRFTRAWRVTGDAWQAPARFDDGTPAVLERAEGEGRVVLFASDLDRRWNDFPLHPSFVPFAIEAVRHVAIRAAEPVAFVTGRTSADVPAEPGIHRLESGRIVAVNVDERESGAAVMTPEEFASMVQSVPQATLDPVVRDQQAEARQSLWQYGLLLMLGVLVVESFVGRA